PAERVRGNRNCTSIDDAMNQSARGFQACRWWNLDPLQLDLADAARLVERLHEPHANSRRHGFNEEEFHPAAVTAGRDDDEISDVRVRHKHLGARNREAAVAPSCRCRSQSIGLESAFRSDDRYASDRLAISDAGEPL